MATGSVVKLEIDHIVPASKTLAQAFLQDPFFSYIFSNPEDHIEPLELYFQALMYASCLCDTVYTTAGTPKGAAVWIAPSQTLTPEQKSQAGIDRIPDVFGQTAYQNYQFLVDCLNPLRTRDMPEPHWYLSILGVDPDHQGKGIGRTLLEPVFSRADASGTRCYLETFTEVNVSFYQRIGFEVLTADTIPRIHLPFWTMCRKPQ